MKYLLYYNLDSKFTSDQTSAGGDGTNVVSVVDGVAWTKDQEKTYYRYSDSSSDIITYTVIIHHNDIYGNKIVPDEIVTVATYSGKTGSLFLQPKSISGLVPTVGSYMLEVNGNSEYAFVYATEYQLKPLTFKIVSGGTISVKFYTSGSSAEDHKPHFEYSLDFGKTWRLMSGPGYRVNQPVESGQTIQFRGDNSSYYWNEKDVGYCCMNFTTNSGCVVDIEGNIMSLINSTGFVTTTAFSKDYVFFRLFENVAIRSVKNLILPVLTLTPGCYYGMFENTNLSEAPELPATTLASNCYFRMFSASDTVRAKLKKAPVLPAATLAPNCYDEMFYGCGSLNYIKCLATDISAENCTKNWTSYVSKSGTFVKDPNMASWTIGVNGIPSGWVIYDTAITSYVQDGLIAHFDGIVNLNSGHHEINATTWYDLTNNGFDLCIKSETGGLQDGKAFWDNDGFVLQKDGGVPFMWYSNKKIPTDGSCGLTWTLEVVAEVTNNTGYSEDKENIICSMFKLPEEETGQYDSTTTNYCYKTSKRTLLNPSRNVWTINGMKYYQSFYGEAPQTNSNTVYFGRYLEYPYASSENNVKAVVYSTADGFKDIVPSISNYSDYLNGSYNPEFARIGLFGNRGILSDIENSVSDTGNNARIKIYAVRLYNRQLTDDEMRANAVLDTERFGF